MTKFMKKVKYFILTDNNGNLFLILVISEPIYLQSSQKTLTEPKKNISSPYFDFSSCQEVNKQRPDVFCLPTSPITFDDVFSSKYQDTKSKKLMNGSN